MGSHSGSQPPRMIGNWWLDQNLGAGVSGSIYKAHHIHTGAIVALKIQPEDIDCPTNRYERNFYPSLQGGKGMPRLWDHGVHGNWDYIVIDLLGPSLDSLFRHSGKPVMDLRSVCSIAQQMIARLEWMHQKGILHRDIQLGNCTVGLPPNDQTIYMIDFGFSKRYIDTSGHHIPDSRKKRDFIGNYWFSSINVHCKGRVPSRRDDMEALSLMLIHMLTPNGLPWTRNGVPRTEAHRQRIIREKMNGTPEMLCDGLPSPFEEFLRYCRRLKFFDLPDYATWREEFAALAVEEGFPESDAFVWPPPEPVYKASPAKQRSPGGRSHADVDDVLIKLAGLKMDDHEVNGTPLKPKPLQHKSSNVIVITESNKGDSNGTGSKGYLRTLSRYSKAVELNKLVVRVNSAADNASLSELVQEFIAVLQSNTSRVVTVEGFAFLEALQKQMADPSVFIRTSGIGSKAGSGVGRSRKGTSNKENPPEAMVKQVKMNRLATLKSKTLSSDSNTALASQVAEFEELTRKSAGHTLTRGGVVFLEALVERLRQISS